MNARRRLLWLGRLTASGAALLPFTGTVRPGGPLACWRWLWSCSFWVAGNEPDIFSAALAYSPPSVLQWKQKKGRGGRVL